MSFDKVMILGAGAIGSVYGALLSRFNDVTLIGNQMHMEAIRSNGLSISGDINEIFRVSTESEIRDIPAKTLIIVTVKSYDLATAVERIKNLLEKDTVILVLENGLGNEEIVKHVLGIKTNIVRGVTKIAAEFLSPGRIKFWDGETIIEKGGQSHEIVGMLNRCGLKAVVADEIRDVVWIKLAENCVVNPLTAILKVRNREIFVDSLKPVRYRLTEECIDVARAEGVLLDPHLAETIDITFGEYTNFSSMYQDIANGKPTEIDFLNGKIVELGKRHGIEVPVNATIVSLVKFLEREHGIPRSN